jgi:hypothetical protein
VNKPQILIPAALQVTGKAIPCQEVEIKNVDGGIIEWMPVGKKPIPIKGEMLEEFLSDTQDLIMSVASYNLSMQVTETTIETIVNSIRPRDRIQAKETLDRLNSIGLPENVVRNIYRYWQKYGPPIPGNNNQVKYIQLLYACIMAYFMDAFYSLTIPTATLAMIYDAFILPSILTWRKFFAARGQDYTPRYWSLTTPVTFFGGIFNGISWTPVKERDPGLWFCLQNPDPRKINSQSKKAEWMRVQAFNNFAAYLSNHGKEGYMEFKPTIGKNGAITFKAEVKDDLILYWLFHRLKLAERKPCLCGCGEMIPVGQDYASEKCKSRVKERLPGRKIKAYWRTRKNRGQITQKQYDKICQRVDDLIFEKGEREEDLIREMIREEVDG